MKKRSKNKSSYVKQDPSDIAGLILKVQQQLSFLERKIDTLIGQSPEKPPERQYQPKPFQPRFDHSHRQREGRPDNNFSQRILHKAVCADCKKECEVPFRPSQDRPVYCRDCFSKRKASSPFKPDADSHTDKPRYSDKKKFFERKRPAVKRRKARG